MQTFGSGFNIVIGTSSSLATGSISTGSFLPAINFVYLDPRYTSSYASGSIASFEPVISNVTRYGATGYLTVKLPDIADKTAKTPNKEAVRFFISGGEARVGIGFDTDKDDKIPQFPLDVKSSKDSAEGTKFVLRHTRPTKGADPGDSAGKIIFAIDSGSYKDLESSGSAGSIESDIVSVDATGVVGDIIIKTSAQKINAPTEVFRVNQNISNFSSSLRVQGNGLVVDNTVQASYGYMGSLRIGPSFPSPGDNNAYIEGELNVNTSFTASGLNYPDTDGLDRQVIKTDGLGNLTFGYPEATTIAVKNVSGGSIPKGTPCYITGSGTSGNLAGIVPADAGNLSLMPAGVIAGETLADEAEGVGLVNGFIQGVDTSAFSSGDTVYVAVGGGYTNVKPTGSGVYIQKLGNVEKVDNTNGSGVIYGPGYYNDLPNWEEGKIMVGTSTYPATSSFVHLDEANSTLIVDGTLSGSGGAQLDLAAYEFGYEITTAFPITGSGLVVSSSNLPANHYNMVKIGETELLDINSLLSPNTFFIHNVDAIVVASGSEPVDIYGEGPGKLFEHNSSEFKVYSDDGLKLTISSGSSAFTHEVSAQSIRTAANLTTSPQYVAVWTSSPQTTPQELRFVTASTFTGGGGSSPYSLGTFGGRYNWGSTEGNRRIAHGYVNGPTAGATANDDNFGPYLDTHTIDSTTQTFNAYKMQYYTFYSPVAGVPHIKAWGRSTDTDFATNGCEMGVSVWSVDAEPANGSTSSPTATLRATSPTFTVPNSTVGYFGNGMEASGSSSLPAGTFYLVTFDLSGSLAATANIYMNFHLWLE